MRSSRLRIDSDPKLLRRVLQNFLTNAFRYAKGQVLLGVRRQGDHDLRGGGGDERHQGGQQVALDYVVLAGQRDGDLALHHPVRVERS